MIQLVCKRCGKDIDNQTYHLFNQCCVACDYRLNPLSFEGTFRYGKAWLSNPKLRGTTD